MSRMQRNALILFCSLSSTCVLAGEAADPKAKVVQVGSHSLNLVFSDPMLTWMGNSTFEGITISPPFQCNWLWGDEFNLACQGEGNERLQPATQYKISIRGGLWTQQDQEIGEQDLLFETQRPSITDWGATIDRWEGRSPVFDIKVSAPVSAAALSTSLVLSEDGSEVPYKLIPRPESGWIPIAHENRFWWIDYQPSDSAPHTLSLHLKPGLRSSKGPLLGVQDEVLLRARINEPFGLRFVGCGSDLQEGRYSPSRPVPQFRAHFVKATSDSNEEITISCPAGKPISLAFSQPLSPESTAWLQSHLPPGLRYERAASGPLIPYSGNVLARPSSIASLVSDSPDSSITFDVPASLISAEGERILRPHHITVTSTDFVPELALEPSMLLLLPGSKPPEMLSMTNMPAINVDIEEIGGDQFRSRTVTMAESTHNAVVRQAPPLPQSEITRHGGLVGGKLNLPSDLYFYPKRYSIAYAAFNITTGRSGDQALVWVTNWKGATPVSNARVELLRLTGLNSSSVVATAQTGPDGVAFFELSELDKEDAGRYSLVRVTRRGQRAVMPFLPRLGQAPSGVTLHDGQLAGWGVSDRPLYRPGDRVRYRLWLRERDQNHLRLPPLADSIKVRLARQGDSTATMEFDATPDAFGSIAGTIDLPKSLPDDDYCILTSTVWYRTQQGVCFRVTNYHKDGIWATLITDHAVLLEGESIELDAEAGYYSGGPAAGAKMEFRSLLSPMPIEKAYPRFHAFTFIDPYLDTAGNAGESLTGAQPHIGLVGGDGHAQHTLTLAAPSVTEPVGERERQPIPFGKLDVSATVSTSPGVRVSATDELLFSRYSRFVGLKVTPWVPRSDQDPQVEAIVIAASGEPLEDVPVDIDIEQRDGVDESGNKPRFRTVGRCRVMAGRLSRCPFQPQRTGFYRFLARSADAASASVTRYANLEGSTWRPDIPSEASLTTLDENPAVGSTIDVVLQQPFVKAKVLISVEHVRLLKHWIQDIDSPVTRIPVSIDRTWLPGVTINAVIIDAGDDAFDPATPKRELVESASLDIHPSGAPPPAPVVISVDHTAVKPGDRIQIHLHNPRTEAVQVTLGVVDDAIRALAPTFAEAANPTGDKWLGRLDKWDLPTWFGLGNWERQIGSQSTFSSPNVFLANYGYAGSERLDTIPVSGSDLQPADFFTMGTGSEHNFGRPEPEFSSSRALRQRILDSPFWQADIVLAPGADRTFQVELPDNLTRWRILAWANDKTDGFTLSEATVEASLPTEVRIDSPTRLFPGDEATVRSSVRARNGEVRVKAKLQAKGAGVDVVNQWSGTLASKAQRSISLLATPTEVGQISVSALATSEQSEDGIGTEIEVSPTLRHERLPVAGWIPANGVQMKLPALPAGAMHAKISIESSRGSAALVRSWIAGLRDNPHAYWEPMLSRAIGAAVAIRFGFAESDWPEAQSIVEAALQEAGRFQDSSGAFHFFAVDSERNTSPPSLMLTAYSIQGFEFLRILDYDIPPGVEDAARRALAASLNNPQLLKSVQTNRSKRGEVAFAMAVANTKGQVPFEILYSLWHVRDQLSWSARSRIARALSARILEEQKTDQLVQELRQAGSKQGMSRSIGGSSNPESPFETAMFEQCIVLDTLRTLDHAGDAKSIRTEYLRGFTNFYSGRVPTLDSYTLGQCLMALAQDSPAPSRIDEPVGIDVSGSGFSTRLDIPRGESTAKWSHEVSKMPPRLVMRTDAAESDPISFVANVEYDIDGRKSTPVSIGFQLERRYSVIRNRAWEETTAMKVREGDWVRVSLRVSTSRIRHFVAISDGLPGGLRAVDLELSSIADLELPENSNSGSGLFSARQVNDLQARFYSEQLPPGTHEVHYYARATHAGRYAAMPAVAELLYGNATVSRTTPVEFEVETATSPVKP